LDCVIYTPPYPQILTAVKIHIITRHKVQQLDS
jgi:hypothetical protein